MERQKQLRGNEKTGWLSFSPSIPVIRTPLLSVIIPTCGRGESLRACLHGLTPERQGVTADCFEIIVTDDGDVAHTCAMGVDFPTVRWVQGPHKGPAANRNNGVRCAVGEWIVFIDDDCLPDAGWLRAYRMAIDSQSAPIYEGRTYTEPIAKGPFWSAPANDSGGMLWSCNMAVRRDVFVSIGGFDEMFRFPFLEDVDFRERLKAAKLPFVFLREAAVFHPLRPVATIYRQAMAHESYVYYAKKHKVSLARSGLSLRSYLQSRIQWFRSSRGIGDQLCLALRTITELAIVGIFIPWWLVKFSNNK